MLNGSESPPYPQWGGVTLFFLPFFPSPALCHFTSDVPEPMKEPLTFVFFSLAQRKKFFLMLPHSHFPFREYQFSSAFCARARTFFITDLPHFRSWVAVNTFLFSYFFFLSQGFVTPREQIGLKLAVDEARPPDVPTLFLPEFSHRAITGHSGFPSFSFL